MRHSLNLSQSVKAALTLGAAASLGTGVAFAQTNAPNASTSGQATQLSKIVVTGSHIPQTEVATAQPIINITRQQIEASGFTNLGQVLQHMSTMGASYNSMSTFYIGPYNPSQGYYDLNLYNLGSQRVLILVDGHRWVQTLGGAVNVGLIPTVAIQSIQVLLNGASAIYGSSAVSGVINIITTKNFEGARASAYLGEYYAHGVGGGWDGRTQNYTATWGVANDRSNLMMSVEYRQTSPITATNRDVSNQIHPGYPLSETGIQGPPYGTFVLWPGAGVANYPQCFYPDSCSSGGGPVGGPMHPTTDMPMFNIAQYRYLTVPAENWSVYVQGHYDLTPNISFKSTVAYNHQEAKAAISPTPLSIGFLGNYTANGMPIGIAANNPYNPFGVDLVPGSPGTSAIAPAWCSQFGSAPGGGCVPGSTLLIFAQKFDVQMGHRITDSNEDQFYYFGGFEGYFQMFGNQWNWNANYVFSRDRFYSSLENVQDLTRVQAALGGNCTAASGCVPLNLFGTGEGITKEQRNYINTSINNSAGVDERIYSADIAGQFWNSWYAGPWGLAAGYQYLETSGFFQPDGYLATGNVTSNAFLATDGRVGQNAQYVELRVPLAQNVFLAKSLVLDLAARWTQFHVQGTTGENYDHAATPKVSFKWQPITQLLIRGSWSQSFREPSVSELFAGQAESFNTYNDPCITGDPNDTNPPAGTYNCPTPSPTSTYGQIRRISGGNPDLKPEKAKTRSAGFVWSPSFFKGFNLSVDYYNSEVEDAVGLLSPQLLINGCYLSDNQDFCQQITRNDLNGEMTKVVSTLINTGSLHTSGWVLKADYRFPATSFGQFALSAQATFVKSFVQCLVVSDANGNPTSQCTDWSGNVGWPMPKHRANASLSWDYGAWTVYWNMQLIGEMWEPCINGTLSSVDPDMSWCSNPDKIDGGKKVGQNHLGTTVYNDIQVNYGVSAWNTTFTLGVNNIFNKNTPISRAYGNPQTFYYRIPGRFIYGKVTVRF